MHPLAVAFLIVVGFVLTLVWVREYLRARKTEGLRHLAERSNWQRGWRE